MGLLQVFAIPFKCFYWPLVLAKSGFAHGKFGGSFWAMLGLTELWICDFGKRDFQEHGACPGRLCQNKIPF